MREKQRQYIIDLMTTDVDDVVASRNIKCNGERREGRVDNRIVPTGITRTIQYILYNFKLMKKEKCHP